MPVPQVYLIINLLADQLLPQRRALGNHRHQPIPLANLQPRRLGPEEQSALPAIFILQRHQVAHLHPACRVVIAQQQLLVGQQRLADLGAAAGLAGGQVRGLQAQGVVLVLGDVLFGSGGFVRSLRRAGQHIQVLFEGGNYLRQQAGLVHGQ
ncbi:hypothetical protein PPS11_40028 [Pseudomonas putida S11]|nr:hypothetical protein PPS11_40028 [Pseudomonas putida S11]